MSHEQQLVRLKEAAAAELSSAVAVRESELEKLRGSCAYYQDLAEKSQIEAEDMRLRADDLERQLDAARVAAESAAAAAAAAPGAGGVALHAPHTPHAHHSAHHSLLQQQHQHHHQQNGSPRSNGAAAAAALTAAAARTQELQQRVDSLTEQLERVREELHSLRTTSEAMLQSKDCDLLSALRKNAAFAEELASLRQASAAHQKQRQAAAAAGGGAAAAPRSQQQQQQQQGELEEAGMWADAASVGGLGRRSSNGSMGSAAFSPKVGARGGMRGGSSQLMAGSSQLLGNMAPSEPGESSGGIEGSVFGRLMCTTAMLTTS